MGSMRADRRIRALILLLMLLFAVSFLPSAGASSISFSSRGNWQEILSTSELVSVHRSTSNGSASNGELEGDKPFLLVGMGGLDTSAVDLENPAIAQTLAGMSLANLTTHSLSTFTCPVEGWLSLVATGDVLDKAGRKSAADAQARDECPPFAQVRSGGKLASTSSSATKALRADAPYPHTLDDSTSATSATVEGFSSFLSTATWPVENPYSGVLGIGPGAALMLANSQGDVSRWIPSLAQVEDLTSLLSHESGSLVIDLGSIRAPVGSPAYAQAAAEMNMQLAHVLEAAASSTQQRRLILASLSDPWNEGRLQFFATNLEEKHTPGVLVSSSTRTPGLVALSDVRSLLSGSPSPFHNISTSTVREAASKVNSLAEQSYVSSSVTSSWYQVFNGVVGLGALGAILLFLLAPARPGTPWGGSACRWRSVEIWNTWAFAFVPAALLLNFVPWWRLPAFFSPHDLPGMGSPVPAICVAVGATVLIAAGLTALAHFTSSPVGVLAATALVLLCVDVMCGSAHQRNGFMGSMILTSRRYYGISNRTYLILIIAGLLALLPWIVKHWPCGRKRAGRMIALLGAFILAVDTLPAWGADFGGSAGIIAAFGFAAILVGGKKLHWWYVPLWIFLTVGVMGTTGLLAAREGESHIGRFWSTLGSPENTALLMGKIRDVVRSFTSHPTTILLLVALLALLAAAWFLVCTLDKRSGAHKVSLREALASTPSLGTFMLAVLLGIVVAVPLNDSGALMLKEGAFIALPAFLALVARGLSTRSPQEMLSAE